MKLKNSSPPSEKQILLWREHSTQLNRFIWTLADELGMIQEGEAMIEVEPSDVLEQTVYLLRMYKHNNIEMRMAFQKIHDAVSPYANVANNAKMARQDGR
jgi:hypothetical protein